MAEAAALHRVELTKGYWIGVGEVTQDQWRRVMDSDPAHFKGGGLPVERVSWTDCAEFCRRLNEMERAAGRLPAGMAYRLPTEAEWEFAARGGASAADNDFSGAERLEDAGWFQGNAGRATHPGGGKAANPLGLRDMSGNVAEWCQDWQEPFAGDAVDPSGPEKGHYRVFRGGSWYHHERDCRVGCRDSYGPNGRDNYIGFRLALGQEL
jgi:formylglycine-generating enzyme required for sulfatase activity